ncbi:MAG: IPExxxVDY family protein [Bacteroidales bacterium]|nr:IPExxxVDY family protein [Bacteroidales bacterium]
MKKTIKIKNEINIPEKVIGISSQSSDYHIAWEINNILNISLFKLSEKAFADKKLNKETPIKLYYFKDDNSRKYYLLENNTNGRSLFLSLKHIDYLLIIDPESDDVKEYVAKLSAPKAFLGCFSIELNKSQIKQLKDILLK